MKRKKYYLGMLSLAMTLTFLFGCNGEPPPKNEEDREEQPKDLNRGVQ